MQFFIHLLEILHDYLALNYGVAIIILTLAVKGLFWGLNAKQYESMAAMRKIQPKLKELQQKHKDNPQALQKEMLGLYKQHNVNPFSGCLPMLIQLPILFVLYAALNSTAFINLPAEGKGFLWIKDISFVESLNFSKFQQEYEQGGRRDERKTTLYNLTQINPQRYTGANTRLALPLDGRVLGIPLLAILVALTTYYSQKTMDIDPEQQKMMAFMPIMMLLICFNLSAGISIYLAASNLVTALQQMYLKNRRRAAPATIDVPALK
ncbi:MAG: YidC/Oxa1 family membrane protein insertase [Candidatus Margulisbacteria bacterium]|jgi:YidC/Oxa1 family membrane protein insertase|nr:YidC/Oxa1 family membrane protein insertase [Candidatus Margulisiibacteriota bacterium]